MCGRQQTDRARQSCCRCSLLDLLYSLCVIWVWGVTVTERERERERREEALSLPEAHESPHDEVG